MRSQQSPALGQCLLTSMVSHEEPRVQVKAPQLIPLRGAVRHEGCEGLRTFLSSASRQKDDLADSKSIKARRQCRGKMEDVVRVGDFME